MFWGLIAEIECVIYSEIVKMTAFTDARQHSFLRSSLVTAQVALITPYLDLTTAQSEKLISENKKYLF
jgi:hypothetical protein